MEQKKWDSFKEKLVENLISLILLGLISAGGYGVIQIFLGDYKLDKFKEEVKVLIVDQNNEISKRESLIVEKCAKLEAIIAKQNEEMDCLKTNQSNPFTVKPLEMKPIQEIKEPKHQINPAQSRIDWIDQHNQKYQKN